MLGFILMKAGVNLIVVDFTKNKDPSRLINAASGVNLRKNFLKIIDPVLNILNQYPYQS